MKTTRSQTRSTSRKLVGVQDDRRAARLGLEDAVAHVATPRGSVPEAGSSRKSRSGSRSVAWATPMRWSMPRE